MKWSDIPQRTKRPGYRCDVFWNHLQEHLHQYKEHFGPNFQLIPEFQRGHVWTLEQQIAYIEFNLSGGQSGRDLYFNSPSWMSSKHGESNMVCVDGLQRITAILAFENNKIKAFGLYKNEFEGICPWSDLRVTIHVNDLTKYSDVLQWYIEMNSGGTPHDEKEIARVKSLLGDQLEKENKNA